MKVIFFNGPPRSGKDTLADMACSLLTSQKFKKLKMANPLKLGLLSLMGIPTDNPDYAESWKDEPCETLNGLSFRQGLIALSEEHVKVKYGKDFFGRALLQTLQCREHLNETYVVADSGFAEESTPIVNYVGAENVLLVRVFRPGFGYSSATIGDDSRSYISLPCTTIDLHNTEGLDFLSDFTETIIKIWSQTNDLTAAFTALLDRRPELGRVEGNYIGNGGVFVISGIRH